MDYSDQAGRWNAVAVDSNGHIHVVQIKDESYQIRHSVNDGTGWISNGINTCGATYCWDIHMVIDDNDHIHLAYTTYTSWDETLVYMNYDGTTWTDTVVSNSAHFGPIGIAVDSNNHPHISYALDGSDQCGVGLRISSYDGSSWLYTNIDQGSNRGCESAIVIDESDHMYIAYQDRSSSKLKIATDKSGSWDSYLVDTGTSPSNLYPGYMTSMAVDQQGQFHIAHQDNKEYELRYSTGAPNSQWTTTIVDATGHTGRDPSIAVDAADQPHIVYHTWTGQNLKYATIDPVTSNWTVTTMASTGDVGEGNSIFIDESGDMHVPFNDGTNDVLKYATKSTGLSRTDEIRVQFGQYGSVTGTVVNDTTITVTTPLSGLTPDTIDITLWDKDGNSQILSSSFEFISQDDLDNDGVLNDDDDCPNDAGTSTEDLTGCPDDDGDGYSNSGDAFPSDGAEWADSDGDSVGDNADEFPSNPFEQVDSDGDGVGDNSDAFPNDASETMDSDGDGVGDNSDAFPMNAFETIDSDGDGYGDNSDHFPNDPSESADSDGDGVGDNSDAFPNDASETMDSDGDGVGDNADLCEGHNDTLDEDGDQIPDGCDSDDDLDDDGNQTTTSEDTDGDGVFDEFDICEGHDDATDVDGDQIPDGCDSLIDSDDDGVEDSIDACEGHNDTIDIDGDGVPYGCDNLIDSDGDGVADGVDECANSVGYVEPNGCPPTDNNPLATATLVVATGGGIGLGSLLLLFGLPNLLSRRKNRDEMPSISWSGAEPMGPPQMQEIGLVSPPLNALGIQKGDGYEWLEWPESSGEWWYRTAHTQDQWQHWKQ